MFKVNDKICSIRNGDPKAFLPATIIEERYDMQHGEIVIARWDNGEVAGIRQGDENFAKIVNE